MARPTVMTPETIDKLRQAYLIGATNEEAAHYAGISPSTIYNHIESNPEFLEKIEAWKNEPILKAKKKVVTDLDKDTNTAKWYLERKAADFKPKGELKIESPIDKILEGYGLMKDGKLVEGEDDRKIDEPTESSSEEQA